MVILQFPHQWLFLVESKQQFKYFFVSYRFRATEDCIQNWDQKQKQNDTGTVLAAFAMVKHKMSLVIYRCSQLRASDLGN